MPTKKQLSKMRESEFEYPETRHMDDPMYREPKSSTPTTMNKTKPVVAIGKTPSQMNGPYWRKENAENVTDHVLKSPVGKVVAYFKITQRTRGGSKIETQFWKTLSSGYMVYVDVTNCKIGIVLGMGSGRTLFPASKAEYNQAFRKVLKALNG